MTPVAPAMSRVAPAVSDSVMGKFSSIAQVIAGGLQDPSTRVQLIHELSDHQSNPTGVDLQACDDGGVAWMLFEEAGRRGLNAGQQLCSVVSKFSGVTLYMDRDRLAAWSPTVAPIVTAIETPGKPLPRRLVGYRSPTRTIAFANDSTYVGPVLVVLPYAHPNHLRSRGSAPMHVETHAFHPATPRPSENN
jgi:hypothetical protein